MVNFVEPTKQEAISNYHETIENFFLNKHLKISVLPTDLKSEIAIDYFTIEIGTARQYYNYLQQEIAFWKENDPQNKLAAFSNIATLNSALSNFDEAVRQSKSNNQNKITNMNSSLNSSVNRILSDGSLYSKLQITRFLLSLKDNSSDFITGVRLCFLKNRSSTNAPSKVDSLDGYYAAMEYLKVLDIYQNEAKLSLLDFKNNIELASANYSALNESYTSSFREQQKNIQEITDQTNNHFNELEKNKNIFFDSANKKLSDLENLYEEKLRLSGPSKYWDIIETDYKTKGTKWLVISCILSGLIVIGLVCMIIFVPQLFAKEAYWIENLKNSVVMTIVTSIAIYMLRLCVKMSTTSFHLSRDAKERSNLSYFYLALIEKDAVSDKERALILNALFSRSDTGLLKGDSTPSMPSNISDLINIIGKANDTK